MSSSIHFARKAAEVSQEDKLTPWRSVGDVLARIALVLGTLCLGIVALVVVVSTIWLMTDAKTGNLAQSMSIYTITSSVVLPILVVGFGCGILVFALLRCAYSYATFLDGRAGTRLLVGSTFVFMLLIILVMQTRDTHWGDSWMIYGFVDKAYKKGSIESLFTGTYSSLFYDARLYFSCYPFQASFFWVLYGLRLMFGDFVFMAFQVLSALGVEVGVVSLVVLGQCLGLSSKGERVFKLLLMLCLPMYWLATFLYGNALGCGFAFAFLALQACSMREVWQAGSLRTSLLYVAASVVPLTLALCIKETFILFVIATALTWIVVAIRQRRGFEFIACLAVILVARALSGLPFEALRACSGGYEFMGPLTTINHLELGLRMGMGEFYVSVNKDEPTYAPGGWSNYANAVWELSSGDAETQNRYALSALSDDIREFVTDPGYGLWFFSVKLATEWADPTYQSLYYLSLCGLKGDGRANPADISTPLGLTCTALTFLLDGYQSVVFISAFGYVIWILHHWKRRHANPVALFLVLVFFTGFGCYLLWEAKAVYVLPYLIAALPLAASGLDIALTHLVSRKTELASHEV